MKSKQKFGWFAGIYAVSGALIIIIVAIFLWQQLSPPEKQLLGNLFSQYSLFILTAGFLLFAGFGVLIEWVFRGYIIPISSLSEEVELIYSANPSHRITIEGSRDVKHLMDQINTGAERYETLKNNVSKQINSAMAESEKEKNILAAIMAELPEAVLICNREGQVILYNTQAKRFFNEQIVQIDKAGNSTANGDPAFTFEEKRFLGIGRSIFELIDKHVIRHALDEMHKRLHRHDAEVVSSFVLTAKGNRLLRAETVPILTTRRKFSGFIIIFHDITQALRTESRTEFLLHSFQDRIRRSAASIKSAIGIMQEYPEMDPVRYERLTKIIQNESTALVHVIQREAGEAFHQDRKQWPLVPVSASDLVEAFRKKATNVLNVALTLEKGKGNEWIRVDSYSMVLILLFLIDRIIKIIGAVEFFCSFSTSDSFVHIDISWEGQALKLEQMRTWENQELHIGKEGLPLYLKEVLDHHEAEIWPYCDRETKIRSCLRLYLPAYKSYPQDTARQVTVLPEDRPEFYNFDLFHQPGQHPDLDDCLLADLPFTVFDTETTGLNPGVDRIISIGAVRIVKLRMLKEERFDALVNPERDIPAETTKIHGIKTDMVRFKPGIDKVLPMFHQFVTDTILVAHNAAFDMRMLQTCEAQTGIKFINPVLDTLLLSDVIHPEHKSHNLSDIAGRLGVEVLGRHTAIGDATTTAILFLKMIPLLGNIGIYTLKEARDASQKSYYARFKF
ncbi:MAG: hypothetical protein JRH03_13745 [Deltaproteobacteria bacterium]|nr:hypothetical protein [Deltaproteobacteria bacterium]